MFAVVEAVWASKDMEPVLLHEEKAYSVNGVACIESGPASNHTLVPEGSVEPVSNGETENETWYWRVHEAVSVIGPFMVTLTELVVPE
jgi:hypothetical protein